MTDQEKDLIRKSRKNGIGYKKIASDLGLSVNSVKSFCRAQQLTGKRGKDPERKYCKQCGKPIQTEGKPPRKRLFCSEECLRKYWNSHHECRNPVTSTCPVCGKPINAYPSQPRKYCSHACYIADRLEEETMQRTNEMMYRMAMKIVETMVQEDVLTQAEAKEAERFFKEKYSPLIADKQLD